MKNRNKKFIADNLIDEDNPPSMMERLLKITDGCREDMHEPDDQGITCNVLGNKLDNAFGSGLIQAHLVNGYQEFVVVLHRELSEGAGARTTELFNLADLIALARQAAKLNLTVDKLKGPAKTTHPFRVSG